MVSDKENVDAVKPSAEPVVEVVAPKPIGKLEISGDLAFGEVVVGEKNTRTLVMKNVGAGALEVDGIRVPEAFRAEWNGGIQPGEAREVEVVFSPEVDGVVKGELVIALTSGNGATTVSISGSGMSPKPAPLGMVTIQGGVLPDTSNVASKVVEKFYLNAHEVTWGEWQAVSDYAASNGYDLKNSAKGSGATHPARGMTWFEALKWCNAKSEKEGIEPVYTVNGKVYQKGEAVPDIRPDANGYRLPTEAEWEWAARGGVSAKGFKFSGGNDLNEVAWNWDNAIGTGENLADGRGTAAVGTRKPNELGLYDMSGNVWEWTWDDAVDEARRIRGGGWFGASADCAVDSRSFSEPGSGHDYVGLRPARNFESGAPGAAPIAQALPLAFASPSSLPAAQVGLSYAALIQMQGGIAPHSIALQPGDVLPSGLTLNNGELKGTPLVAGRHAFTIVATDSALPTRHTAKQQFILQVAPYGLEIESDGEGITGNFNQPMKHSLRANGGTAPYRWSVVGKLPSGLYFNAASGTLTGKPTGSGNFTITLRVVDAKGLSAMRILPVTIRVEPLEIEFDSATPPSAVAGLDFTWGFKVRGGEPPYKVKPVGESALPDGLTLSFYGSTGRITGKPAGDGKFPLALELSDSRSRHTDAKVELTVEPYDLAIGSIPSDALAGKYAQPLRVEVSATGGKPPYRWTVDGSLPRGVSLGYSSGVLAGTPSSAGTFPIQLVVTDASRQSVRKEAAIEIGVDPLEIKPQPDKPPTAMISVPYSWPIEIKGGIPPYTLKLGGTSNLPRGLWISLNQGEGRIYGKPSEEGSFEIKLEATDAKKDTAEITVSFTVEPYNLAITETPADNLAVKYNVALNIPFVATGGMAPYSWTSSGAMPRGLRLDYKTGVLSGTPMVVGEFPIALKVTDANRVSSTRESKIVISSDPLKITTDNVGAAKQGEPYSQPIETSGGVLPITLKLKEGNELPAGLVLGSGKIAGIPKVAGTFAFVVEAKDATGSTVEQALSLTVAEYGMKITGPKEGSVREGEKLRFEFGVEGGKPPYAWTTMSPLPAGLYLNYRGGVLAGSVRNGTAGDVLVPIKVVDGNSQSATFDFSIKIAAAKAPAVVDNPIKKEEPPSIVPAAPTAPQAQPAAVQATPNQATPEGMILVQGGKLPGNSPLGNIEAGSFFIGRNEVTWGEWKKVSEQAASRGYDISDVGTGSADSHPVHKVNWFDALKWCNLKSELDGLTPVYQVAGAPFKSGQAIPEIVAGANGYRLPTEAEWEWAARGGASSKGSIYAGSDDVDRVAWHAGNNSPEGTKPVGTKAANELGIHDMSGNVQEWCWDAYKSYRRYRGGSANSETYYCTVVGRDFNYPDRRTDFTGFRIVRDASR